MNEVVLRGQTTWEDAVALAHEFHLIGIDGSVIEQIVLLLRLGIVRTAQHTVVLVDLHPCGWTPRTHKELQLRTVFLGCTGQRDNVLFVSLNVKVPQAEVAHHVVALVPRTGIVVGVHRHAPMREPQVTVLGKEVAHHLVLVVATQQVEGIPV